MSYYHLFKRTVKSKKGKPAKKWYSYPPFSVRINDSSKDLI